MKKFKHITGIVLRSAIMLIPAIVAVCWLIGAHGWVVTLLAALGVEFIIGVILSFGVAMAAQIKVYRDSKKEKADHTSN
ncbi:MAG: hypothetical protein BHV69_09515 [Bacteroidales bacterium 52_46]|nr:MAG: hypothetical protein BHV69_09515 [Bacteroidales bacterium 52_46]